MANRFWVGGSGTWDASSTANWSATTGGASGASAPVAADAVFFDANSGAGTCTTGTGATCSNITFNTATVGLSLGDNLNATNIIAFTLGAISLGSYVLSCVQLSSSNANVRSINFGTGSITLTGNSLTIWNFPTNTNFSYTGTPTVNCTYAGATGTRTLSNGQTAGQSEANAISFNVTAGTDTVSFLGAMKNLNFTGFGGVLTNAGGRVIYGNLTLASGMTVNAGANPVSFSGTSGVQQITTNGKTLDFPLTFNGVGETFSFQDALTQGSTRAFTLTNGTVQLKDGTTSTVGAFATSGTNQKFLESTLANTQATLSKASGTVNASYLTIKDINATGGAIFNAFTNSGNASSAQNINAGNNIGWNFVPTGNGMMGFF